MRKSFKSLGKRALANRANERGSQLDRQGKLSEAIREYEEACRIDPEWSVPAYNLGLIYKYRGDWERSLQYNLRASELNAEDEAAWWNLGIAATALGRWDLARTAWRAVGLAIPDGDGPIDFDCGVSPVRLNADTDGEVVWSERLDPARAVLRSIPLPDSGFHFGDVVLNDGAPTGHRKLGDHDVPVFNCLGLLTPSGFSTWVAEIEFDDDAMVDPEVFDLLDELASDRELGAENWSTSIRVICKACSEGNPDAEHHHSHSDEGPWHRLAIAAPDSDQARRLLEDWKAQVGQITILSLEIASSAEVQPKI